MTSRRSDRRPGEFELIARYFSPLATSSGALGLLDDAALLRIPARHELVATADAIVERVHFLASDPPATIAQKALRVNLSDLAAKGAKPAGYLMTLALPPDCTARWLRGFARGLALDQRAFGVSLLGGDTTQTDGPLTVAITALGFVQTGKMVQRSGARSGDLVYVTGTIGDAGTGLSLLKKRLKPRDGAKFLISRYRLPTPRLSLGQRLHGVANATIDVSDGLMADVGHIAEVSGVRIVLQAESIPLSRPFRTHIEERKDQIVRAATSGDDFEIVFTCPPARAAKVEALRMRTGVPIAMIGRVQRGRGVVLQDKDGRPIRVRRAGYTHF